MNKKQWISSILAAAVLSSPIIMPTKGSAAASFIDIDGSYAKKAIVELFDQGIVTGVGESKFYPTSNITRQDFAIILAKTLKLDVSNPPALPTFLDVPTSNYAYSYVEAAVKAGLIKGTGSNLFGTGQNLSRQDMVVMFVRALGVNPTGKAGTLQFADSSQIADYSKDFIAAAVEYGLITGYNNFFNPDAKVDRQAVALVASKFLKFKENGNTEQPASTPTAQPSKEPVTVPTPVVGGSSSSQSEHSSNSDTNAPMVESTKFEAIDNYNGTQDQLRGLAGAIGEQGAAVQAYLWTDANENGEVDADELGTAIALGTSEADGSVSAANIGDLNAGTYTFVITAKDSSNNESAKKAAHAVTVTLSKNEVPDTTAPVVDATKFEAIDNYNGTQDQLRGLAGAIGEQGAAVQAYLWTDANENGEVDADELGTAIALGTSAADGSVSAANIGDLNAGTYRFVITAKDSSNNESAKNAAHAVTIELVNGVLTTPTVTSSIYGFDGGGGSKTKQLITGSTQSRIRFDFFSGESFTNAEIQVTLEGITFTTNDYYTISGWTHPTSDQISNNGHTLTFTGSNIGVSDIAFELHNKVMPAPGTYLIKFKADADGPGTARSYSEEQVITLIILPPA
ncbi:Endo-1,4-beta-xylanase A precursor [compost metagenome]